MDDWVKITKESGSVTDITNGTKYSRMDQVKFVEENPLKIFSWSILKYFVSSVTCNLHLS